MMQGNETIKVALVRCGTYNREEVEAAVEEAIRLLNGNLKVLRKKGKTRKKVGNGGRFTTG